MARPPTPAADWLLLPTYHALLAVRRDAYEGRVPRGGFAADVPGFASELLAEGLAHRLPFGRPEVSDPLLVQPPLAVTLDDATLAMVLRPVLGGARAVAATTYGPTGQGKYSNEDFALAATMTDAIGRPWAFAAVADGVSQFVLWSERAARIAAVVALHVARAELAHLTPGAWIEGRAFAAALARNLTPTFQADRTLLSRAKVVSDKFVGRDQARYLAEHGEGSLYASTLLVTLVGPAGGCAVWAGDGALTVRHRGAEGRTTNRSVLTAVGGSNLLNTWVGLGQGAQKFESMDLASGGAGAVWLASDGADNARHAGGYPSLDALPLASGEEATEALDRLAMRRAYEDNYAAALAAWEPAEGLRLRDLATGREQGALTTTAAALAPGNLDPRQPAHAVPGAGDQWVLEYTTTTGVPVRAPLVETAPLGHLVGQRVLLLASPRGAGGRIALRAMQVLS